MIFWKRWLAMRPISTDEFKIASTKTEVGCRWTFIARFLTYFDMDDLIGDYEVTTVSGLIVTELNYSKTKGQN
jgi:hypothetical protein